MLVRRVRTGVVLLVAAGVVMTGPAVAASAGSRPDRLAGTGEVIAALNAVSGDGSLAVGADSISTFLDPLCGSDLSERRGPAAWKSLPTPSPPTCGWLDSVVTLPRHRASAVGYQTTRTGKTLTLTEFYNGSRWTIEKSPSPGSTAELFGVTATKTGTVWAVGFSATASSVIHSLVLKRTASGWAQVAAPGGAELHGVTVTPSGQVWAVGSQFDGDLLAQTTVTMRLGAQGWQVVPSPSPGEANSSYLDAVAVGPRSTLWAVGWYFDPSTGAPKTLTERYTSGRWSVVPSPSPGSAADWLYSVAATSGGGAWAVGGYTGSRCERALAEQFTGGAWHLVNAANRGPCTSANANALYGVTIVSAKVYAVGQSDISTLAEQRVSGRWKVIRSGN
jgi:hypothetical protein